MEYIEFEEWKKFKKEKKYKEAVETLEDEMATNLIRVHNFYSDVKYDEKKDLGIAFGTIDYAKDSKFKFIEEMTEFSKLSSELSMMDLSYLDILEDSIWGTFKEVLKDGEKLRKKIIKEFKKIQEV